MIDKEFISNSQEDLEVSKTEVAGNVKGVNVPLICIPASEYVVICKLLGKYINKLSDYVGNISDDVYDSSETAGEVGKVISEAMSEIHTSMIDVFDYEYNKDCKISSKKK